MKQISKEVIEHVAEYLKEHDLGELVTVRRASNHPEDSYLYHVITRKPNISKTFHTGEYSYSCFTSWNETTKSLNFGHYNLQSEEEAEEICKAYYNNIFA